LHSAATDPKVAELVKSYDDQIAVDKKKQEEAQTEAKNFEVQRDQNRHIAEIASSKGGKMGMAISLFSVAVAVASICLVTKKKPLWFMSMLLSAGAIFEMIRAYAE
jgi:hypothetical protein